MVTRLNSTPSTREELQTPMKALQESQHMTEGNPCTPQPRADSFHFDPSPVPGST